MAMKARTGSTKKNFAALSGLSIAPMTWGWSRMCMTPSTANVAK